MAKRKELEKKKELARMYYMQGVPQKTIADKVEVSTVTINRWVKDNGWEAIRAGINITRPELVNKQLLAINTLLDKLLQSDDPLGMANGVADRISKLAASIEKIDKKANVVDAIEVFMAFNKWIQFRQSFDKELTPELVKAINKYQDIYITEQMTSKK